MKQSYHSNATTNVHIREQINQSSLTNSELALKFNISTETANKWKNRVCLSDKSSCPLTINYALDDIEQLLAVSIRRSTWLPIDEVWEMMLEVNTTISRSSVYRTFKRNAINYNSAKGKEKDKTF